MSFYDAYILLFDDFQDLHGSDLDTDAAGDALGNRIAFLMDHDLGGADFDALAAANALLLVDHVNAGLGILGDGFMLADLHALAALDADAGLCAGALGDDLDAAQILVEFLIERLRACAYTLQASHTLGIFLNYQLLHRKEFSFISYVFVYYTPPIKK